MVAAAALGRPDSPARPWVSTAKAYLRPNGAMLKHADGLLGPCSGLGNLSRSRRAGIRGGPVRIPLTALGGP